MSERTQRMTIDKFKLPNGTKLICTSLVPLEVWSGVGCVELGGGVSGSQHASRVGRDGVGWCGGSQHMGHNMVYFNSGITIRIAISKTK